MMVLLTFRGVVSSVGRFPCGSAVATCQGKAAVLIGEGYANRWSYKVKVTDKDDQQSALTSDVHDLAEGGDSIYERCPACPVSEPTKRPTALMISGTLPPSLTRFVVGFDGTFHSKNIS